MDVHGEVSIFKNALYTLDLHPDSAQAAGPLKVRDGKDPLYLVLISIHGETFPKHHHCAPAVVCIKHHRQPLFFII